MDSHFISIVRIITICLFFIGFSNAQCQVDWQSKVLSYYNFDGNTEDWGPKRKDAIEAGNISYGNDQFQNPNSCLKLDTNNGYLAIPVGYIKQISISFYVLVDYLNNEKTDTWLLDYNKGNLQMKVDAFSGATLPSFNFWQNLPFNREILSTSAFSYNKWYHIYLDVGDNQNKPKLYIDGLYEGEANFVMLNLVSDTLFVGRNYKNESTRFAGRIDELRVFAQPLTEPEIQNLSVHHSASLLFYDEEKLTVFPNPAKDNIYLKMPQNSTFNYEIRDLYGRRILDGIASETIDISGLKPNSYILILFYEDEQLHLVFVKV